MKTKKELQNKVENVLKNFGMKQEFIDEYSFDGTDYKFFRKIYENRFVQ